MKKNSQLCFQNLKKGFPFQAEKYIYYKKKVELAMGSNPSRCHLESERRGADAALSPARPPLDHTRSD